MTTGLRAFQKTKPDDPEFPDEYEIEYELKSPLSVLWYNLRAAFEDDYPAKMNPDFARDMITWYSNPDDIVWDGCGGSGIVTRQAERLGRNAFYSDINPKAVELAKKHAVKAGLPDSNYYNLDARHPEGIPAPDLILSSLPFGLNIAGDKNHYTDNPKDISNSKGYPAFFLGAHQIIKSYFDKLKPGGICILDARDRTKDSVLYDLINYFRNMAIECGFELMARYMYFQMPYRTMTVRHRKSHKIMPMVAAFDCCVFYKPEVGKLI